MTLTIGILLLVLVTLATLYGARVAIMEQRISANEYRAKEAFAAAQAGIDMGLEYVKANKAQLRSDSAFDDSTTADDGWFLAGAEKWTVANIVCDGAPDDPVCATFPAGGTIYYYGSIAPPGDVPNTTPLANNATYNVDFAMCAQDDGDWTTACDANAQTAVAFAVLITATGTSADGTATADVRTVAGTFDTLPGNAVPPLMAGGTISGSGTFEVVTNPNAGGPGVPISAWAGDDLDLTGAATTCQVDEFYTSGSPTPYDATTDFLVCDDCDCSGAGEQMTHTEGSIYYEGIDIVDNDDDAGPTPDTTNFPGMAGSDYPTVFEYVFGTPLSDYVTVKQRARIVPDCGGLGPGSSGFIWVEGACNISGTVGHPLSPVLLVGEGDVDIQAGGIIFGMIFMFDETPNDSDNLPSVALHGGPQLYGAVVAEELVEIGNGNFQLIFSQEILQRVQDSDEFKTFGRVPGTWTDYTD